MLNHAYELCHTNIDQDQESKCSETGTQQREHNSNECRALAMFLLDQLERFEGYSKRTSAENIPPTDIDSTLPVLASTLEME